jgi:hypothetical protein
VATGAWTAAAAICWLDPGGEGAPHPWLAGSSGIWRLLLLFLLLLLLGLLGLIEAREPGLGCFLTPTLTLLLLPLQVSSKPALLLLLLLLGFACTPLLGGHCSCSLYCCCS